MNASQWDARQKGIREIATRLQYKCEKGIATIEERDQFNNLMQALLALLPMVTHRVFEAAKRNSEINSLIRTPKNE